MKNFFLFISFLSLCSCATEGKYKAKTKSWVGRKSSELIHHFGLPDDKIESPNGSFKLVYNKKQFQENLVKPQERIETGKEPLGNIKLGSISLPYGSQKTYIEIPATYQSADYHCRTEFEVDPHDNITNTSSFGNSCRAL